MVCVPEESHAGGVGAGENLAQSWGVSEISVRFDDHCDAAPACVGAQIVQARSNASQNLIPGTFNLVSEYANVGSAKRSGQIDESLGVGNLLLALLRIGVVKFR